jgi:hypothetical protein
MGETVTPGARRPHARRSATLFLITKRLSRMLEKHLGKDYLEDVQAEELTLLIMNPLLSFLREGYSQMLGDYYQKDIEDPRNAARIAYLQQALSLYGLAIGSELESIAAGASLTLVDPAPKYLTYPELLNLARDWRKEHKRIGLVHGTFDPPHIGHSRTFYMTYPYCDILLIGFDPNTVTKNRKGDISAGDIRPRFPQLAWRMWEVASLPTVDYVFVGPVEPGKEEEQWSEICRDLNIKILGTNLEHTYLAAYQKRMENLGGYVITEPGLGWTSTRLMRDLECFPSPTHRNFFQVFETIVRDIAEKGDKQALATGYLRDYPNGT